MYATCPWTQKGQNTVCLPLWIGVAYGRRVVVCKVYLVGALHQPNSIARYSMYSMIENQRLTKHITKYKHQRGERSHYSANKTMTTLYGKRSGSKLNIWVQSGHYRYPTRLNKKQKRIKYNHSFNTV